MLKQKPKFSFCHFKPLMIYSGVKKPFSCVSVSFFTPLARSGLLVCQPLRGGVVPVSSALTVQSVPTPPRTCSRLRGWKRPAGPAPASAPGRPAAGPRAPSASSPCPPGAAPWPGPDPWGGTTRGPDPVLIPFILSKIVFFIHRTYLLTSLRLICSNLKQKHLKSL